MSKDGCRFFNLTPTFEDWLALMHREIDAARPDVSFINIVEDNRKWRYDSRR